MWKGFREYGRGLENVRGVQKMWEGFRECGKGSENMGGV